MNENLRVLRTNAEVEELKHYLLDKEVVAWDTETDGLGRDSLIIGYSLCAEPGVAFYVVTREWLVEEQRLGALETLESAPEVMQILLTKQLVAHNAGFDVARVIDNYSIDLMPAIVCDTMIAAHLLDENRRCGLKELGVAYYGASAKQEQIEMKASVERNGGQLTKGCFELFKADSELIGKYACKDALLTYNLFYEFVQELIDEDLADFFFKDESMPLLRGPTHELNRTGLKVDLNRLASLKKELEIDIAGYTASVHHEIAPWIKEKYPGTSAAKTFNINSGGQLAWLLFDKLEHPFIKLSDTGKELATALGVGYIRNNADRDHFIKTVMDCKGSVWREAGKVWDKAKRKYKGKAKVRDYWNYLSTDKSVLNTFAKRYVWVETLLKWKADLKLLGTYVGGIEEGVRYGVIYPSFLQHGTTSGRYSSRSPNYQNLPRSDKRVKSCMVARPGKVFIGADYSQLEPRVFASVSGDEKLMACFASGEDFYSVVGAPIHGKTGLSLVKDDPDSFAKKYPNLRDGAKVLALATPYGRTARQQAAAMGIEVAESERLIKAYFTAYPKVELMMLESHALAKRDGQVVSLFGRPRRIPDAKLIVEHFGDAEHKDLPYEARGLLNLAMNHRVQSTAASIMNRASIAFYDKVRVAGIVGCHIVLQIHDELVAECFEGDAPQVSAILKDAMENTVTLPGVALKADPKIGRDLAELK